MASSSKARSISGTSIPHPRRAVGRTLQLCATQAFVFFSQLVFLSLRDPREPAWNPFITYPLQFQPRLSGYHRRKYDGRRG